jgi:hypothetical protein
MTYHGVVLLLGGWQADVRGRVEEYEGVVARCVHSLGFGSAPPPTSLLGSCLWSVSSDGLLRRERERRTEETEGGKREGVGLGKERGYWIADADDTTIGWRRGTRTARCGS